MRPCRPKPILAYELAKMPWSRTALFAVNELRQVSAKVLGPAACSRLLKKGKIAAATSKVFGPAAAGLSCKAAPVWVVQLATGEGGKIS